MDNLIRISLYFSRKWKELLIYLYELFELSVTFFNKNLRKKHLVKVIVFFFYKIKWSIES